MKEFFLKFAHTFSFFPCSTSASTLFIAFPLAPLLIQTVSSHPHKKKTNKLVEPVKNRCSTNMTRKQQIKIDSTYQFVNITKIYAKKVHTMIGWLAGWEYVSKCKKMLSVTIKKKRIKIPALLCKALWELLSRSQYTDFASTKKKENNKKASLFIQSEEYVKITSFSLKHGLTEQQQNTAFSLQQP